MRPRCPINASVEYFQVIEVMGEENVKMTTTQVEDVLTLLRKEEQLKEERRQLKLQEEVEQILQSCSVIFVGYYQLVTSV